MHQIPTQLINSVANAQCVLFVGAGLSKHAQGFPSWDELAVKILKSLPPEYKQGISEIDARNYKLEFFEYVKKRHPIQLEKALLNILKSSKISDAHRLIARMPFAAIITMNFDTLIEDAFRSRSREPIVIESDEDIVRLGPESGVPIFKMHGSLKNKNLQVLSLEDYERFDQRKTMKAILLSYITRYPLLVLGAGLSDPNFLMLNGIIHQIHGGYKNPVFYLHPGLPNFVTSTWSEREFSFIECEHDKITDWLRLLAQDVEKARQLVAENKGAYLVNRFLKKRALETLGPLLHDYEALQCEYTANIHMRDYGWFAKSWEDTLYEPLSDTLETSLDGSGSQLPSLLYVAPGPHAPVLSRSAARRLSKVVLADIDEAALWQANDQILSAGVADHTEVVAVDFTDGIGAEFCARLNEVIQKPILDACAALKDTSWVDERFQLARGRLPSIIKPILSTLDNKFDVAYSEMVAAFTVTPVILAFRSKLYLDVKNGKITLAEANQLLASSMILWKEYNLAFFKFHLAMLAALIRPGGQIVIAVDTEKVYDDEANAREPSFSIDPGSIQTHDLSVTVRLNKKLRWRDHDYGFGTDVYGTSVPDFKPHVHEIRVITYKKYY